MHGSDSFLDAREAMLTNMTAELKDNSFSDSVSLTIDTKLRGRGRHWRQRRRCRTAQKRRTTPKSLDGDLSVLAALFPSSGDDMPSGSDHATLAFCVIRYHPY